MQRRRCAAARSHYSVESDDDSVDDDSETTTAMRCISCLEEFSPRNAGTCKECYEEASETEEELKREIEDLKAKVAFLRFWSPPVEQHRMIQRVNSVVGFADIDLVAADSDDGTHVAVRAHKAVLVSRSPVFKAMLENEMEESRSSTIKITDASYDALRAFVNYFYTAEAYLDDQMAGELLVLAEKYQVKHLKAYCEKFMVSKLIWENAIVSYAFAHQHNAKQLLDASLSMIIDNMEKLTKREEYKYLVEKDPRLIVEVYEAYLAKQVNMAAHKDSSVKS